MTNRQKIALGCDHAGFLSKESLKIHLDNSSLNYRDFGCYSDMSVDYPDFAHLVAYLVETGEYDFGILICGSGQGVSMTANKHPKVRAALCWNNSVAELSRQHNDANVLCLPARFLNNEEINGIVDCFLSTSFEGGRHKNRISKIELI